MSRLWRSQRVRQGGTGMNCRSSGAGRVEEWLQWPFGCGTSCGGLLAADKGIEAWVGLRAFLAQGMLAEICGSRVSFIPLPFPSRPVLHIVFFTVPPLWGAFYHLCSHPFLLKLTFFLSLFIAPYQSLLGFGKWAGISGSFVLAVGKVIKGGMKRGEGPVQRWRQHFSNFLERDLLLLNPAWCEGCLAERYSQSASISVLGDGGRLLCKWVLISSSGCSSAIPIFFSIGKIWCRSGLPAYKCAGLWV